MEVNSISNKTLLLSTAASSINIIHCFKFFLLLLLINFSSLPILLVQSLPFNITNFDDASSNMAYQGDGQSINGSIELNKVSYLFRVGRAIYAHPLHLWDSSSKVLTDFSTSFTFIIDTVNDTTTYGDGFAFYMAPLGYQIPPNSAGGTFALFNATTNSNLPQNHVFAVEFDTFVGSTDPPMRHVGIDDNSLTSVAYARFDIDNNTGNPCHTIISYSSSTKTITVSWSFNGRRTSSSSNSNSLSYNIDLMKILPEFVNIGFSASTGLSTERNVIQSWQFSSTLNSSDDILFNGEIKKSKSNKVVVIVVAVICTIVLVLVGIVVGWLIIFKKRRRADVGDNEGQNSVEFNLDKTTFPRRFDYKELLAATNGFADDNSLGRGGSGLVYKGVLSNLGRVVAVKKIFADFENSERVFTNEVRIISRLIHRNLVQFIGWCHEEGELLLVFEYMPNGSLDTHLFGNKKTLPWDVRYKIALGIASAIRYLHEDAEQCVLHRDIKSANVLLDTDFSTKLGDFGMAKLVDPRLRTQRTGVVGTYGYLAPEYINGGRASKESDIYSFGVVALEIASGRRTYRDGEFHVPIINWIWQLYVEGNIINAADERLNKDFNVNEMLSLLTLGLWCTHPIDKERPKAAQVIKVLQLEASLPVIPHDIRQRSQHPNTHEQYSFQAPSSITTSLVHVGR